MKKIKMRPLLILALYGSMTFVTGCQPSSNPEIPVALIDLKDTADPNGESIIETEPVAEPIQDTPVENLPDAAETGDLDQDDGNAAKKVVAAAVGGLTPGATFAYLINTSKVKSQNPSAKVYIVDLFDNSASQISAWKAKGKTVICYFSAGSYENWRPDKNKFPKTALGRNLDGWAGERWLNYRDGTVRSVMASRISRAKSIGCQGVDPDNIDGHLNSSGFSLSAKDQLDYFRFLSDTAHKNGLSIGMKNSAETVKTLQKYADFAVIEECFRYNECGSYSSFKSAGKAQFMIEYRGSSSSLCAKAKSYGGALIFADLDLTRFTYCK